MMNKKISSKGIISLMLLIYFSFFSAQTFAQKKKKKNKKKGNQPVVTAKKKPSRGKIKPYSQVITKKAKTDKGLYWVHKVGSKYYFEIPDSVMNKEILIISRISGTIENLNFGGAGMRPLPPQVLRWERRGDNILARYVSYDNVADSTNPIHLSVKRNNFEPVVASFPIQAIGKDSSYVINVNRFFTSDVKMISPLSSGQRRRFGVRNVDKSRSYIDTIKSFPRNVEVKHVLTYNATKAPANGLVGAMSLEMRQSMVLLPEKAMMPRFFDPRVGYFSLSRINYGLDAQKATRQTIIKRWRLEPKDPEAFARGELVEPVKPIVYYIDPATPMKWRPYLKKGVEDWQVAFEAAGFKNAIIAKDPPTKEEDPEFDPEDVRYSVIRYTANPIQNAMGPSVADPRTGEIIESDIIWYHNVMNLLRNWYFIQTAARNPKARKVKFDDEVMGRCIRFVSSHEVGHTLGLPHNMGASSSYPVDSLRSASFTKKMGTAPSIMDYARFNYIAQPGDGDVALMPNIGVYDIHAIRWGYRPIPSAKTPEEEKPTLNSWITEKANNPMYRFGKQMAIPLDPSSQTEDLGDDSMKASTYGIKNLQVILVNLIKWIGKDGETYEDLQELYFQVLTQWNRYMGHVTANVGGIIENYKTFGQKGAVYTHVPKDKQKRAIKFLIEQAFKTPKWMIQRDILEKIEPTGVVNRIQSFQKRIINNLLDFSRLARLLENESLNTSKAYTCLQMFDDLRAGVWTEVKTGQKLDMYRRNLQRSYVEALAYLMKGKQQRLPSFFSDFIAYTPIDVDASDIRAVARGELKTLQRMLRSASSSDKLTRYHYEDVLARIDLILNPK